MPHAAKLHAVQQSRLFRHQVWPCTFLTPLRNFGLRNGHGHKERHESSRRRIIARSHLYLYLSEVGGVSPTGKSFRSFVRACERSCVCPRDDVVSVAGRFFGKSPPGRGAARALPRRALGPELSAQLSSCLAIWLPSCLPGCPLIQLPSYLGDLACEM